MIIALDNVRAHVLSASDVEREWLSRYLVFEDGRAKYSPAVKKGFWDGKIRLFDRRADSFPAGLLGTVRRGATRQNLTVEVKDARIKPEVDDAADVAWLRDYQHEALDIAVSEGRGILQLPTAAGKTEIFVALTRRSPVAWVIFVNKKDLLKQGAERYKLRTGETPGMVGDGRFDVRRVTFAMFQTCRAQRANPRMIAMLNDAQGFVMDECHGAASKTAQGVLSKMTNAYWRFGVSGTPLARGDGTNLLVVAQTGGVIFQLAAQKLIDAGVLSRPTIRMVPVIQHDKRWDWQPVYRDLVVNSQKRNEIVTAVACAAEKPCLLFVKEIAHGRALMSSVRGAGISCEFVHGMHQTYQRKNASKRLLGGTVDVLIASKIFEEGVDLPELRSVVIAAGGKSVIQTLQRLGRGMRKAEGKSEVEIWDFDDRGNVITAKHSDARIASYRAEAYEVLPVGLAEVRARASQNAPNATWTAQAGLLPADADGNALSAPQGPAGPDLAKSEPEPEGWPGPVT